MRMSKQAKTVYIQMDDPAGVNECAVIGEMTEPLEKLGYNVIVVTQQERPSTPAQRANFGQGDLAIINTYVKVLRGTELFQGDLLQFIKDDGTTAPHWEILSAKNKSEEGTCCYVSLNCVTKLQPAEQANAPTLTLAQQAGFEVGDFGINRYGVVVKLARDDGTFNPYWKPLRRGFAGLTYRISLSQVRRLAAVQERNDG